MLGQNSDLAFMSEAPAIADGSASSAGKVGIFGHLGSQLQVICLLIE